ncbi:MAG: hypothetical protein ACYTET_01495 [Planctomycetota bacterium]|jgi:hypothetical protein
MAKKEAKAGSDVYTALLALASLSVLATAGFVTFTCWTYYGTLFSIAQ